VAGAGAVCTSSIPLPVAVHGWVWLQPSGSNATSKGKQNSTRAGRTARPFCKASQRCQMGLNDKYW
jgi:hypothetical protein